MTVFSSRNRSAFPSLLLTGLLALFLLTLSQPQALVAAPIILQANSVTTNGCGATLSGSNFSFVDLSTSTGCSGRLSNVGIPAWPLPEQASFFNPVVSGTLSVPENPGRLAIAYGGGQPDLWKEVLPPTVPGDFTGIASVNVALSGTVQVCLEPAGVQTPGQVVPCDPLFTNFAVININVAGLASFQYFNGFSGARDFIGFSGTSAAAPEPASLGITAAAAFLFLAHAASNKRRKSRPSSQGPTLNCKTN